MGYFENEQWPCLIFYINNSDEAFSLQIDEVTGLALVTQPSDFIHRDTITNEDVLLVKERLFSLDLEKGVIRRARLAAIFIPLGSEPVAAEYYHEIAQSLPPLAT